MGLGLAGAYGAASVNDSLQQLEAARLLREKIEREKQKQAFEQAIQAREADRQDVDLGFRRNIDKRLTDEHPLNLQKKGADIKYVDANTGDVIETTTTKRTDRERKGVLDARRDQAVEGYAPDVQRFLNVGGAFSPGNAFDITGDVQHGRNVAIHRMDNAAAMDRTLAGKADKDDRTVQIRYKNAEGNDVTQFVTAAQARDMGELNSPGGQAVQKKRAALQQLITEIDNADALGKGVKWSGFGPIEGPVAGKIKGWTGLGDAATNQARKAIDNLAADKIHERYGGALTLTEVGMSAKTMPGSEYEDNEDRLKAIRKTASDLLDALSGKKPATAESDALAKELGLETAAPTNSGGLDLPPRSNQPTDAGGLGLPRRARR